jgi:hypothetical protein
MNERRGGARTPLVEQGLAFRWTNADNSMPYATFSERQAVRLDGGVLGNPKNNPDNQCDVCGARCRDGFALDAHLRAHAGVRQYECNQCDKRFTQKNNLTAHMRTHSGHKPFQCQQCERAFSRKDDLRHHMRLHSGQRPHECSECEKSFTRKDHLDRHLRSHSDEKSHTCDICQRSFTNKSHLNRHKRLHTADGPRGPLTPLPVPEAPREQEPEQEPEPLWGNRSNSLVVDVRNGLSVPGVANADLENIVFMF